jgi:hypothetical protein
VGQREAHGVQRQAAPRRGAAAPRRDLVACGVRLAAEIVVADGVVRDKRAVCPEFASANGYQLPPRSQGWGRRPARGETYGANYIDEFYDGIVELYERGNLDKNSKVSPDQVREQLRRKHPDKFCIPGVWALQNTFIALGQKKKPAAGVAGARGRRGRRGRASALPADVLDAIDGEVAADSSAKPAAVLAKVLARFELDPSLRPKVKARVSQAKTKLKKKAGGL